MVEQNDTKINNKAESEVTRTVIHPFPRPLFTDKS